MARLFPFAVLAIVLAFYFNSTASRHVQSIFQNYLQESQTSLQAAPFFTRKIIAVGDLHGDLPNALKVLQMAHVVDAHGNWSGEIDFFVQTGDIIDRGDDTIKLYELMELLREQAQHSGGEVLSHLGNHEWMNAIGDWRYVYPSEISTFGSVAARQKELSTGEIGRAWAQNYSTASRLPLHPSIGTSNSDYPPAVQHSPLSHAAISFVHGGLAPTYPHLTPYPSAINGLSRSLLHKLQFQSPQPSPHPPNPYPGLPSDTTWEEERMYGTDGPLWYRGWALESDKEVCSSVDGVLEKIGVRRMIMGHTPDFQKIVSRCDGKIIIIDTGISHAYGGALSALAIQYTLTPTDPTIGRTPVVENYGGKQVWKETEVVTAIYEDRDEVLVYNEREVEGNFAGY